MNQHPPADFALDPRLKADTRFIARLALCEVLLMDDSRFPWLILVPAVPGAAEIVDLDAADRDALWRDVDTASRVLRQLTMCEKLNIGALGNMVRQLHVHIIGRYAADAAWPGPVWGSGPAEPYDDIAARAIVSDIGSRF